MNEKLKKIIDYSLIFVAFICAIIFYYNFDLETILWNQQDTVKQNNVLKEDLINDHSGYKAGEDVPIVKTKEEYNKSLNSVAYIAVEAKSVIKTNIYSLAKWEDHYDKNRKGQPTRKRNEVQKSSFDYHYIYTPYYIVELADGSHILAQMNRGVAKQLEKGKITILPLGKKLGFSKTAKNMLEEICKEYNVETDYVLYMINDKWEESHSDVIFLGKIGVSFVVFIILAVIFQLVADKIMNEKKERESN